MRPPPQLPSPPGIGQLAAIVRYDEDGRRLVADLKFANRRGSLGRVAAALAAVAPTPVDLVTWPPTGDGRRRRRGYDQAELLARAVGRHLGRPARRSLRRRPGAAQTGRGAAARHAGPAFDLVGHRVPPTVLLVDDVATTGATLSAAARALRSGGATTVHAVVVARTPLKPEGGPADALGERMWR